MDYQGKFKKAVFGGFDKDDVFRFFTQYDEAHKNELAQLNGELDGVKSDLSAKEEELAAALQQLEEMKAEKDALELSLAEKEKELEKAQQDVQSLRAFNSEVAMKKSVLESGLTKANGEKAELEKKLSDFAAALQQATDYRTQTQQQLSCLQAEKEELQANNVILVSEKAVLEAEKAQLQAELNEKTPAEKLGAEISNIVVEAKSLADRIVNKAYSKATNAENSIHSEQKDAKDRVHAAGEKLRGVAASYKAMAEDFARQLEELCSGVDDAEHKLDKNDFFFTAKEAEEEAPASMPEKKEPTVFEDYSQKIREALFPEGND